MQYNPETGRRLKHESGAIDWVHNKLKKSGTLPEYFNLQQCFFGEHLLKLYSDKPVAIVESEKSTLIANAVFPDLIWLAAGNLNGLSLEKCKVLKGGIHKSLTTHPNTKYANLSEEEAIRNSIQRGITNSEGMGFGLWATAELIKKNNGRLIIHSGNYQLDTKSDELVKESPYWEGTYTFITINTLNKIDYSNVFNDVETRIDLLNEKKEEISNDNLDDLW